MVPVKKNPLTITAADLGLGHDGCTLEQAIHNQTFIALGTKNNPLETIVLGSGKACPLAWSNQEKGKKLSDTCPGA